MVKTNLGTGAGGKNTNFNGLKFENDIKTIVINHLETRFVLRDVSGKLKSKLYEIYDGETLLGFYGTQAQFYVAIKRSIKIDDDFINGCLSKKINPDGFIISLKNKEVHILEKKWQQTSGSVDEKLQTAPYKISIFEKLFRNTNFKIYYEYILSSWFSKAIYDDLHHYYEGTKQVTLWTESVNLEQLNLIKYLV